MQDYKVQSALENRAQKVAVASLPLNPSSNFFIETRRNRVYSTVHGRFLQPDPIGFDAGDVNWYRYVFNSPVNYIDPSGLMLAPGHGDPKYKYPIDIPPLSRRPTRACKEGDKRTGKVQVSMHKNC
ncbi:MAG: RHS repeat-associated core domain-containing protein [Methylacidiphilales bacterium]|nr:RHS repeat-associated core domain-containing protein [Candidatus Methylacidiphilales bacterium]